MDLEQPVRPGGDAAGPEEPRPGEGKADARAVALNTGAGLAGAAVGAGALLLTIMTQKPAAVVPWALVVLAGIAFVPLLRVAWRVRLAITLTIATTLAVAGVAAYLSPNSFRGKVVVEITPSPSPVVVTTPPPVPSTAPVTVISPDPTDARPVPGCFSVRLRGEPPAGYAYAVGTSTDADPRLYFEGSVKPGPGSGEWTAQITIGTETEGMGRTYHITVVALEKKWADYLSGTRPDEGATWWTSIGRPPDSALAATFDVRRNNSPSLRCA